MPDPQPSRANFATTRWSLVVAASSENVDSRRALAELCESYWPPIYAYIRRRGHTVEAAQDLTQSFMTELLERDLVARADADRGKFRSFLLGACRYFLSHERERQQAIKRGGGAHTWSFDFERGESIVRHDPSHDRTPERCFEREWALTVLRSVLDRLREEYAARGKSEVFTALEPFISAGDPATPYAEVAATLSWTPNATKVAVHRLRGRYRELLRSEVGATLDDNAGIDDELATLLEALGS
ncbi:MAG: sigma-70 family RNA polymerase sigma factor [Planctomycetota bacterium]